MQQIKIAVGAEVVTAAPPQKPRTLLSSRGRVLRRLRREGGDFDDFGSDDG